MKEALLLEKRYSKHRDSNSFRAAEEEKKLKRAHPVTENPIFKSALINVNSMVNKINGAARQGNLVIHCSVSCSVELSTLIS